MDLKKDNLVQEIERKWLVDERSLPKNLASYPFKELVAGYFKDNDGKDMRIRKEGDRYFSVKKRGRGLVKEIGIGDIEITKKEFASLWTKTERRRLWKKRYFIPLDKLTIELDVYHDFNNLYTAEVEFKMVEDARKFTPPSWFGLEVTDDSRYSSNSLATHGLDRDLGQGGSHGRR